MCNILIFLVRFLLSYILYLKLSINLYNNRKKTRLYIKTPFCLYWAITSIAKKYKKTFVKFFGQVVNTKMADDDEIDILGDFSFNSCFAQNDQGMWVIIYELIIVS